MIKLLSIKQIAPLDNSDVSKWKSILRGIKLSELI